MSLIPPPKLQKLQAALHARAAGLGRLLLHRPGQRYLPDDQCTRPVPVPQVVASQAQEAQAGSVLVLESMAGKGLWPAPTEMGPAPPAACERVNLLREPDAGDPQVRFDERDVETEHGAAREAPATERAGNG